MAIFDPIRAVRKLRDNGVPEPQAEATVEVVQEAAEAATDGLATKADIAELHARFDLFEARMEARFAEAEARNEGRANRAISIVIAAVGVIAIIALAIAEFT